MSGRSSKKVYDSKMNYILQNIAGNETLVYGNHLNGNYQVRGKKRSMLIFFLTPMALSIKGLFHRPDGE